MPKIAIIRVEGRYTHYDDYDSVIESISDWADVSNEEVKLLRRWLDSNYRVLEFVPTERIPLLVKECLELSRKKEEAEIAKKAAAAKKQLERDLKKKAKAEEQERLLLEELKRKYEEENASNQSV